MGPEFPVRRGDCAAHGVLGELAEFVAPSSPPPHSRIVTTPYIMDALPAELLEHIISDCHSNFVKIAKMSSVSRARTEPVERLTFRILTVATDELDDFVTLFDGPNISRWAHVAEICVVFVLDPLPNPDGCCAAVRSADRQTDSRVFSVSVVNIFTTLEVLST